ncbi:MAG: O-antigen ligase family protein [Chloroflexi bacterium]|nr:O-antigen ligase family protein [Chloroflexota bacterium]
MSRNALPRIALLTIVPYMLLFGAAFNGIVLPVLQVMHLVGLGIGLGVWLAARTRGGWEWHPTALDGVIWLWVVAIVVAGLAIREMLRRGQPALWFLTALMMGWTVLHDALSNRAITRGNLIDMVLLAGVFWIGFGLLELFDPTLTRDGLFGFPRIGGITGNPNLLSAVLIPLIGMAYGRAWSLRGMGRAILGAYCGVALLTMVLTYSRGGWIGAAAVTGMMVLMAIIERGWATPAGFRAAWGMARVWQRATVVVLVVGTVAGGLVVGGILIDSLDDRGRTAELRTYLWEAAWDAFTEKPLTGSGLFSTPRLILDRSSVPPRSAQPHAHNFPLQVLAELGILGGVAMLASVVVALRAGVRAWRSASTLRERHLISAGWAASVGSGICNLFDLAAWTPYVSLLGLLALMLMTAPPVPVAYPARRGRIMAWAAALVALVLMLTGIYSYTHYARYDAILKQGREQGQRLEAAAELEALIAADPRQPVYRWTQGILYGMMAHSTQDAALAQRALERFSEAGEMGMDSAVLRLNQAALAAQIGDLEAASGHLERMLAYAPESITMVLNAALAAERWGWTRRHACCGRTCCRSTAWKTRV